MIRALMVDVDGVLVPGRLGDGRGWATDLQSDLGLAAEELHRAFFEPFWREIIVGQAGLKERLEPVLRQIAPELAVDRLVDYWFEKDARLDAGLLEELDRARAAGTRIYLATNQEHMRAAYLMERMGLAEHVDGMFYSAALGCKKPDPAYFSTVSKLAGLPGPELALLDDSAENVGAAKKAGWCAVQWTEQSSLAAALAELGSALQCGGADE